MRCLPVSSAVAAAVALALLPGCQSDQDRHSRVSQYNLKQMGLALQGYNQTHKHLPPSAICDKDGKPLLSWRVLLLPYLEEGTLYGQFSLDEPWDSKHNIQLLARMPAIYALPGAKAGEPGSTYYQAFVGKGTGWGLIPDAHAPHKALGLKLDADFPDGPRNTIAIIEGGTPVPWTKPIDLPYEQGKPLPKIGGVFEDHANAAMFDGSVVTISSTVQPSVLEAAVTRAGGETLPQGWAETR
jgi:hypothetical protein